MPPIARRTIYADLPSRDRVWLAVGLAVPAVVAMGLCYVIASQGLGWRVAVLMAGPWLVTLPFSPVPTINTRHRPLWVRLIGVGAGVGVWAILIRLLGPLPTSSMFGDFALSKPPVSFLTLAAVYSWWLQKQI